MRFRELCVAIFFAVSVCACGTEDNLLPNQRESIVRFLDSKKLDYTIHNGAYKHIANKNRADYQTATVIAAGDSVKYNFEAYVFTSAPEGLFFTNKPYIIDALAGLNSTYWPRKPIAIKVGSTPMVSGLANAIPDCRQGDSVLVLMTSDVAFDDKIVGVVPANNALMYILNIENVKK